ncbi:MAG: hypothetical protein IPO07_26475 [Haliscomenobacter sp.]|nr:hypothetical protein [Haliscomenobacter sp.]MBK9491948.1 hypothetical protein [Haliscomenobacter sp.]
MADLEIHEASMELVVATHGRGIYKLNLRPIQAMAAGKIPQDQDFLFEIPEAKRPWFNSSGGEPDYRTLERTPITFWLAVPKPVTLSIRNTDQKILWKTTVNGQKGFNQVRWDLVTSRQNSDYPYFVHYERFLAAGAYQMVLSADGNNDQLRPFIVVDSVSPYAKER